MICNLKGWLWWSKQYFTINTCYNRTGRINWAKATLVDCSRRLLSDLQLIITAASRLNCLRRLITVEFRYITVRAARYQIQHGNDRRVRSWIYKRHQYLAPTYDHMGRPDRERSRVHLLRVLRYLWHHKRYIPERFLLKIFLKSSDFCNWRKNQHTCVPFY